MTREEKGAARRDDLYEAVARVAMPHPVDGGKFKVHWLVHRAAKCPSCGTTMAVHIDGEHFLCPVCGTAIEPGSGLARGTLVYAVSRRHS